MSNKIGVYFSEIPNVHMYIYDTMDMLENNFVANNIDKLPPFRREKCMRYRQESDKRNSIIAYLLLERGLKEQYGVTTPISFIYNRHGKPYLQEYPHIFFNISHCKLGVVCVLSDVEIGVDIQDIRPFNIKVAQRVCTKDELQHLKDSNLPAKLFCRMWATKESYAKAKGIGIANMLKQDIPQVGFWFKENEHYCVVVFL